MRAAAGNPLRQALWPLGLLYGAVGALRNWTFAAGARAVHRLGVPVVSIGNLTVGGTGKTPTVAWLAELARDRGKRPGVLARGYGRSRGSLLNDEGTMLQRRLPWLLQEQDPDRVAAGRRLCERGADFILLDDGFQHRRLHRDHDVVCLDATLPFGNGQCLPAGDLREFRSGLQRAHTLLLTRAGSLPKDALLARMVGLRQMVGAQVGLHAADHTPRDVVRRPDGLVLPLAALARQRVVLLSAIARPASFHHTAASLGAAVVGEFRHRDHHRFTGNELAAAVAAARAADALLLTTEKDDARIDDEAIVRHVLRIDLRFVGGAPTGSEFGL